MWRCIIYIWTVDKYVRLELKIITEWYVHHCSDYWRLHIFLRSSNIWSVIFTCKWLWENLWVNSCNLIKVCRQRSNWIQEVCTFESHLRLGRDYHSTPLEVLRQVSLINFNISWTNFIHFRDLIWYAPRNFQFIFPLSFSLPLNYCVEIYVQLYLILIC